MAIIISPTCTCRRNCHLIRNRFQLHNPQCHLNRRLTSLALIYLLNICYSTKNKLPFQQLILL
jgi:hypothetical protein